MTTVNIIYSWFKHYANVPLFIGIFFIILIFKIHLVISPPSLFSSSTPNSQNREIQLCFIGQRGAWITVWLWEDRGTQKPPSPLKPSGNLFKAVLGVSELDQQTWISGHRVETPRMSRVGCGWSHCYSHSYLLRAGFLVPPQPTHWPGSWTCGNHLGKGSRDLLLVLKCNPDIMRRLSIWEW